MGTSSKNVTDVAGRQRRPDGGGQRQHVGAGGRCLLGHRVRQGALPRRLHQGQRDDILDPEGPDQVLKEVPGPSLLRVHDQKFVSGSWYSSI